MGFAVLKYFKKTNGFGNKVYNEKYSSLTFDLSTSGTIGTYWNIFVMLRWWATGAILIFLRDHTDF